MSFISENFPHLANTHLILSVEEEADLWKTLRTNTDSSARRAAKDKLTTSHLPVCQKVAAAWINARNQHLSNDLFMTLVEETIEQITGVEKRKSGGFNPDKGRFCTYLQNFSLKNAVFNFMMQNGFEVPIPTGRLNVYLLGNWGRLNNAASQSDSQMTAGRRFLFIADIAKRIGLFAQIKEKNPMVYLDHNIDPQDDGGNLGSIIGDDHLAPETMLAAIDDERALEAAHRAVENLDLRSKEIIRSRVLTEEKTLADLAAEFNISGERVRQIQLAALETLRKELSLQMAPRRKSEHMQYIA